MQRINGVALRTLAAIVPLLLALVGSSNAFAAANVQIDGNPIWAGYHISLTKDATLLSSVSMSWNVPNTDCQKDGTVGIWTGLGGVTKGNLLVQTGTATQCSGGNPNDYSWYEMAPLNQPQHLGGNYPVYVGDSMGATVEYNGNSVYVITLFNNTQHWSFVKQWVDSDTSAVPQSAECELEDLNYATLPQFTTVNVTNCGWEQGSPSVNSQAQPMSAGSNLTKDVININHQLFSVTKTHVSDLGSDGMSFSIDWLKN